jgi:hypothetical protein
MKRDTNGLITRLERTIRSMRWFREAQRSDDRSSCI